jgi:hypothetical protein
MTVILQHQFWGLKVTEELFEVTLSFRKVPATLVIPFAALTQFVDPGVDFGLQFREIGENGKLKPASASSPALPMTPDKPDAGTPQDPEKPAVPGEVVSLDAFRKK